MADMGAEVGQKMRSAIKAKLTELDCYVDDELPDYIMVMVANKRTKSQMNEDLNLFLNTKTSTFVDWLHIVLKKLREVTVTNLEVYKKVSKRKSTEFPDVKLKREKKLKKEKVSTQPDETTIKQECDKTMNKSLTDDLPLNVKSFSESRKILMLSNSHFEKPQLPLSESDKSNLTQLETIEKQIKTVKSRLGLKLENDLDENELRRLVEESRKKPSQQQVNSTTVVTQEKILNNGRHIEIDNSDIIPSVHNRKYGETAEQKSPVFSEINLDSQNQSEKREHSRIIFSKSDFETSPIISPKKKKSILDRLGVYGENKKKLTLGRLGHYTETTDRDSSSERGKSREKDRNWKDRYDRTDRGESRKDSRAEDMRRSRRSEKNSQENTRDFSEKGSTNYKREEERQNFSNNQDDLRKNLAKGRSSTLKKDLKNRLGISSKITVPQIDPQLLDDTFKKREVVSVVKVKPRVLPPNVQQANKNLLLKAVADAQKSIAQSKSVGKNFKEYSSSDMEKSELGDSFVGFRTKHYKNNEKNIKLEKEKEKTNKYLSSHMMMENHFSEVREEESQQEYIPRPMKRTSGNLEYVPNSTNILKTNQEQDHIGKNHKFIVTLDGIKKTDLATKISAKERLHGRKTPSPIIFEEKGTGTIKSVAPKCTSTIINKSTIPDELPVVTIPGLKSKEKCKYYPSCKNGENCEYFHSTKICEQFPYCKFGDKCLYIHPNCKFGASCTRRSCPFNHAGGVTQSAPRLAVPVIPLKQQSQSLQICKYFPMCTYINCSFYHPTPCKFGKYCKNQAVCKYSHNSVPNKSSLTWRSK